MAHIVAVGHHNILLPRSRAHTQSVEGGELGPRDNGLALVARVLLVLALDCRILAILFTDDVNAHILPLQTQRFQNLCGHIFKPPDIRVLPYVLQIEYTKLFKDITTNLLVGSHTHLCERVSRLFIPLLTLGNKLVKEISRRAKKDLMEIHCSQKVSK